MSQTDFQVSKEGIKLSYLRFVSDSAIGYAIILFCILAYKLHYPLPISGFNWLTTYTFKLGTELKIFMLLLLFLLATPLGLLINALGWFLLGWVQKLIVVKLLPFNKCSCCLGTTKSIHKFDDMIEFFNVGKELPAKQRMFEIYELSHFLEELISIYFPNIYSSNDHVKGISRLARSIALVTLCFTLYFLFCMNKINYVTILILPVLFIVFIVLSGLVEAFYNISILFSTYVLCCDMDSQDVSLKKLKIYISQAARLKDDRELNN